MVGALLKGKYGLSGAYTRPELRGGGGGRSINPGRFSGKGGGRKWCSSLGPKHTAVFNHQKHAGDKMHLISHTHTHTPFHRLWLLQPSGCLLSLLDAFIALPCAAVP